MSIVKRKIELIQRRQKNDLIGVLSLREMMMMMIRLIKRTLPFDTAYVKKRVEIEYFCR